MYLNKAFIVGNVTRDPEVKSLPNSGGSVVNFSMATNKIWTDQHGEKKESTEFHNIVVFGKLADIVGEYVKKGASVLVEGKIQTRSWDANDGTKKYKTEIIAENIQF